MHNTLNKVHIQLQRIVCNKTTLIIYLGIYRQSASEREIEAFPNSYLEEK